MIEAVLESNIEKFASINVGVPPFGTFLVGISALTFRAWLDVYRAGLLAPIIASSASAPLIYLILQKHSEKAGLVAALIFSLDPYLVQFSSAYLDAIGAFFQLLAMFFFITSKELSFRRCLLIGFFLMTSILTKFTFAIFTVFFIIFLVLVKKDLRAAGIMGAISIISVMLVPWLWFPRTFQAAFTSHMTTNSLLPPIIFGPIMIGVMESYPWYILTYFGLGQVHWRVLPSISHIMLFLEVVYAFLRRSLRTTDNLIIFVASSILAIAFIPRNYWTHSWGGGFLKSESVLFKQFYPYYFYPVNLASGMLASDMMFDKDYSNNLRTRIIVFPIILYSLTAPFTLIMNGLYPYWDFIFTLILGFSRRAPMISHYGLISFLLTLVLLGAFILIDIMILKGLSKRRDKIEGKHHLGGSKLLVLLRDKVFHSRCGLRSHM